MADTPEYTSTTSGAADQGKPEGGPYTGMPRWVKLSAIIVGILILLVVVVKLSGLGGEHGPGRHTGHNSAPQLSVTELQTPDRTR